MYKKVKLGFQKLYGFLLFAPVVASAADQDLETIGKPILLIKKLIFLVMAIMYALIAMLWIILPAVTVSFIYRHYKKKEQDGQQDVTGDMNKSMIIGGFVSIIASFIIIGLLGNIIFPSSSGGTSILTGIQNYYAGFMENVRSSFFQANSGTTTP